MKSSLRHAVIVIAVAAFSLILVAVAASSGKTKRSVAAVRRPVITSVKVRGGPSHPVFTVLGHRLKLPKPNPATSPSNQPLCPVVITGNAGFDYGNSFFVIAWNGQANATNAQRYAAGRYRPTVNELDCIGIVVVTHSATRITFKLGHGYQQLYSTNPGYIENGDVIEVGIRSARFATVVHY